MNEGSVADVQRGEARQVVERVRVQLRQRVGAQLQARQPRARLQPRRHALDAVVGQGPANDVLALASTIQSAISRCWAKVFFSMYEKDPSLIHRDAPLWVLRIYSIL